MPFPDPSPSHIELRATMPSKYVAKSYVDSSVAKLSNEMTAEMEKTIGETKEGLQTIVRPIIDRLDQLSLTECTNVQDPHVGHDNISDTLPGQTIY